MKIKQNKNNIFDYFTEGPSLLFVKFLYDYKPVIYNMIVEKPKTYKLKKFIRELKKLIEYDFTEKDYENELPKQYICNVLYEILIFEYKDLNTIDIFNLIDKNMNKEYIFQNFELWWYQSLFMIGGSGYIRDINDYLKKYWDTNIVFTKTECKNTVSKSFYRNSLPRIFSEKEFDIFIHGYNPYYPPSILDTKKMNNEYLRYQDGSRMF